MKRLPIAFVLVLMLGMVLFVPDAVMAHHQRPRPTPPPTPVGLTAPTLISPANEGTAIGSFTLVWNPVPGAARYHIQASGIIEYWGLKDTSYSFTFSPGFVTYIPRLYWRVQAIDANNVQGPWSEWRVLNLRNP